MNVTVKREWIPAFPVLGLPILECLVHIIDEHSYNIWHDVINNPSFRMWLIREYGWTEADSISFTFDRKLDDKRATYRVFIRNTVPRLDGTTWYQMEIVRVETWTSKNIPMLVLLVVALLFLLFSLVRYAIGLLM